MAAKPSWKVGQKVTLKGTVSRTLEDDGAPLRVVVHLSVSSIPITLHETSIERLDPRTEGIADDEPVSTTGTITRIGPGGHGAETISLRLDSGVIVATAAVALSR